jgi:phosphatidate cytidylyltransferase
VTAQLRWVAGTQAGYLALGSLVIAAKSGDIGAYTLGRLFGRRKMVPRLSPGKTWMGGLGALLGAAAGSWAWLTWGTPLFNSAWQAPAWYWSVLYGAIIGVVGLIGDLCESLIKRDVGQKDSAALLPGFGGLLDLLDSVLYAGPVAYVLWLVLPLATWR